MQERAGGICRKKWSLMLNQVKVPLLVYLVQVENREDPVPSAERRWVPPLYATDRSVNYGFIIGSRLWWWN